jgi:hypothetical protein
MQMIPDALLFFVRTPQPVVKARGTGCRALGNENNPKAD